MRCLSLALLALVVALAAGSLGRAMEMEHGGADDAHNDVDEGTKHARQRAEYVAQTAERQHAASTYHNLWAVHVPGDRVAADAVARQHGFVNKGPIGSLSGMYHFVYDCEEDSSQLQLAQAGSEEPLPSESHAHITPVSRKHCVDPHRHAAHHTQRLLKHEHVRWAEQQKANLRLRRGSGAVPAAPLPSSADVPEAHQQRRAFSQSAFAKTFNDPSFGSQWHIYQASRNDHNILPVWHAGITGSGVVVTIVDDGIEHDHPDLQPNYDAKASTDLNGHDDDPYPDESHPINKHGTRCSGEVSSVANNRKCGVGVAYSAKIGGIRMLDGPVSDSVEGGSLSLNPQHIDIYSNSWGPNDDGSTLEGPGPLARKAFQDGISKGRGGKGSIFLFASGNGGTSDDCNCDGYTNSPYTLSIGAIDEHNSLPYYMELCASTVGVAYSSGSGRSISTVDLHHSCTSSHSGTSAAAPLGAGLAALVLDANPSLTWRDVQHIFIRGTDQPHPESQKWDTNGAGLMVSYAFGFGVFNAEKMVNLAREWTNRPEQLLNEVSQRSSQAQSIPNSSRDLEDALVVEFEVAESDTDIRQLEHVQLYVEINTGRRGDVMIDMESPAGTMSRMLKRRSADYRSSRIEWSFMSLRHWAETPVGTWKAYFRNYGSTQATLALATLKLYGTVKVTEADSSACPKGTFMDAEGGDCAACDDLCDQQGCFASGPAGCHECLHYRHGDTCVLDCSTLDMRNDESTKECLPCSDQCADGCLGPADTDCIHCKALKLQQFDQVQCVASCPIGFYQHNNECLACHEECGSCTGPTAAECVSCLNFQLQDGTCVSECPLHSVPNDEGICSGCDAECRGDCSGTGPRKCDACKHLRIQVVEDSGDIVTECVAECPDSRMPDANNVCECEVGYYADHRSLACHPCSTECDGGCDGPRDEDCVSGCTNVQYNDECLAECPTGHFESNDTAAWHSDHANQKLLSDRVCQKCDDQCAFGCSGPEPTDCLAGERGHRCVSLEQEGACVATCDPTHYADGEAGVCHPCHEECDGCNGDGPRACLQCAHFLQSESCVSECSEGYFATATGGCFPCHSECASECFGQSDSQCFASPADAAGDATPECRSVSLHKRCLAECPAGFYEGNDFVCQPCNGECGREGCTGPDASDCVACKHLLSSSGVCTRTCEDAEYANAASECVPCDASCAQGCRGPGPSNCIEPAADCSESGVTEASCTEDELFNAHNCTCVPRPCSSNLFLDGDCVPSCPSGTFQDGTTCSACTPNCDVCHGADARDCDECVFKSILWQDGVLRCLEEDDVECPSGTYESETVAGRCEPCPRQCETCVGPDANDCLSCLNFEYIGRCLAACPEGTFFDPESEGTGSSGGAKVCQPCHGECEGGCFGGSAAECSSCKHFIDGDLCVGVCPSQMYPDRVHVCRSCHSQCLMGCTGPSNTECLEQKCKNVRQGDRCVETCDGGFYRDSAGICQACHSSCSQSCTGPSSADCFSTFQRPTSEPTTTPSHPSSTTARAQSTSTSTSTSSRRHPPSTTATDAGNTSSSKVPTSSVEVVVAIILGVVLILAVGFVLYRKYRGGPSYKVMTSEFGEIPIAEQLHEDNDTEFRQFNPTFQID